MKIEKRFDLDRTEELGEKASELREEVNSLKDFVDSIEGENEIKDLDPDEIDELLKELENE